MPAIITLSRMSFHSSGVKFDLSVMGFSSTFEFTAGAVPADHQSADAYEAQVQ